MHMNTKLDFNFSQSVVTPTDCTLVSVQSNVSKNIDTANNNISLGSFAVYIFYNKNMVQTRSLSASWIRCLASESAWS